MEAEKVISMRNALKSGKNFPLIVYMNNMYRLVDESNTLEFTKWDDENHILYVFGLSDPNISRTPSNVNNELSVFAVDYEAIEAMEIARLPREHFETVLDSIIKTGTTIGDKFKQTMINVFNKVCANRANLTPTDINDILGAEAVNDKDDYYNGKFTENYAETRRMADHNKYVDSLHKNDSGE